MTKTCRYCGTAKPLEEFVRDRRCDDGRRPQCKPCRNAEMRKNAMRPDRVAVRRQRYEEEAEKRRAYSRDWYYRNGRATHLGLTVDALRELEERQQGRCMICGEVVEGTLHADHDAKTGRFRGLLCGRCNRGLGMFKDDVARLLAAAAYLFRAP